MEVESKELNTIISTTFSKTDYVEYYKTGDQNYWEHVVEKIIISEHSDSDMEIDYINSLDIKDKRKAIISLLDKDHDLWVEIVGLMQGDIEFKGEEHSMRLLRMLRAYVKVAVVDKKNFSEVMTPFELIRDMLSTLPRSVWGNPDLKWLDPANGVGPFPVMIIWRLMKGLRNWEPDAEKRYKHIVENMIYVCELQPKNMIQYITAIDPQDKYTQNVYCGSYLPINKEDGFSYHMRNVWKLKKFDVIVANPPYNQLIDLKFLTKSHGIADKVLFVHPLSWLLDEKNKQKRFTDIKNLTQKSLKSVRMFNANGIFGVTLHVPCGVNYFDIKDGNKNNIRLINEIDGTQFNCNDIYDINKYNTDEYTSIKRKLEANSDTINLHLEDKEKKYWVKLAQIMGDVMYRNRIGFPMDTQLIRDNFYTLVTKHKTVELTKSADSVMNQFSFDTEEEANNFLNYVKTKFVRFALSIYKINTNCHRGEINLIPWLDFTEVWDDTKLKKHFKITHKEWRFIDSVIPDYY